MASARKIWSSSSDFQSAESDSKPHRIFMRGMGLYQDNISLKNENLSIEKMNERISNFAMLFYESFFQDMKQDKQF